MSRRTDGAKQKSYITHLGGLVDRQKLKLDQMKGLARQRLDTKKYLYFRQNTTIIAESIGKDFS
jgi:hypothetical protein